MSNLEISMKRKSGRRFGVAALIAVLVTALAVAASAAGAAPTGSAHSVATSRSRVIAFVKPRSVTRAALPAGAIKHIFVIELENTSENVLYGDSDADSYLEDVLEKQGVFLPNVYASGHDSLDNYIASVSGQAPAPSTVNDCTTESTTGGVESATGTFGAAAGDPFDPVLPGTLDANQEKFPGQVDATTGCVYPSSVETLANQIDSKYGADADGSNGAGGELAAWRDYEQGMGAIPARDFASTSPVDQYSTTSAEGLDCANPGLGNPNDTNSGVAAGSTSFPLASGVTTNPSDEYAVRHDPFQWFSSIISNTAECDANVVPLGTVTNQAQSTSENNDSVLDGTTLPETYTGNLWENLQSVSTTPAFGWITPDLCSDGHGPCVGADTDGQVGAAPLTAINSFLESYVPLIEASPAYKQGHTLIVITTDEGEVPTGGTEQDASAGTGAASDEIDGVTIPAGPSDATPGYPPTGAQGTYTPSGVSPATAPGGGKIGTLIIGPKAYIKAGSVDTTGQYDQYSMLRSYEDLLGITTGGTDGFGHLGYAALPGLKSFGPDVFNAYQTSSKTAVKVSGTKTVGHKLTITATVSGGSAVTGTVTFKVGSTTKKVTLKSDKASFSYTLKKSGSLKITASYSGDQTLKSSTARVSEKIAKKKTVKKKTAKK
jgi:phosphatidylinositol-3-phosphatase